MITLIFIFYFCCCFESICRECVEFCDWRALGAIQGARVDAYGAMLMITLIYNLYCFVVVLNRFVVSVWVFATGPCAVAPRSEAA